ncbi:MAG: tRNA (guanosine(46)-N7)-methyltransferase TrmB [Cryomorphaceae bacterium]|nr:tRNA (guanosine(46)-N7)-methyltransferase TrmB [Cryomorphaceae bacterium]
MGKDKLWRFSEIQRFPNVTEAPFSETFPQKGKWKEEIFKNEKPIVLELGCGKGEYAVGLGKMFPEKNFLGIDIKGNRIYIGAKEALENSMDNVQFLRTRIDFIENFFEEDEIDEIWLTFSDPQPKKPRKRLTSPLFIGRYRKFLKKNGLVHVKTDSDILFEYTEEQIKEEGYKCHALTWDLYGSFQNKLTDKEKEIFKIKTHYEELFTSKGSVIKYCCFEI